MHPIEALTKKGRYADAIAHCDTKADVDDVVRVALAQFGLLDHAGQPYGAVATALLGADRQHQPIADVLFAAAHRLATIAPVATPAEVYLSRAA